MTFFFANHLVYWLGEDKFNSLTKTVATSMEI